MQSAQHSLVAHSMALRNAVSMLRLGRRGAKRCRDTQSQAHVNTAVIVMAYPVIENLFEMPLFQRYEEVQTLPADSPDQTSQTALAWGACGGVRRTRTPIAATP
jgi:hypothetical protein